MSNPLVQQLDDLGYAGPFPVLSAQQCREFLAVLSDPKRVAPLDWPKGCAVTSRAHFELANHPAVLRLVEQVLGEDIMLFGACVLTQKPGADHPWHSDMETSGPVGKTVSVWIGLENVDGPMQFVTRSHRFGATVQEVRQAAGVRRKDATADNVLAWARQRDARAELVTPAVRLGEALAFVGQAWHHSRNLGKEVRRSILLQYATPETPIRIPAPHNVEWPFQFRQTPRPACILLKGGDNSGGVNRIVPPPPPATKGIKFRITDQACPIALPLAADPESGFTFYPMFAGATAGVREMEVHVSALRTGQLPHPPHTHREEEILIMLAGEADLILPKVKGPHGDERFPLRPGEFVYYPAHFPHTLRTTSAAPAHYLMFKWDAEAPIPKASKPPLAFGHFHGLTELAAPSSAAASTSVRTKKLLDGPTDVLRKLHAHASVLEPGAGYAPHADSYDVAIVVLEGEVETHTGDRVGPGGTLFHAAGQQHGLRNPGAVRARYLVFEFHAAPPRMTEVSAKAPVGFMQKVVDPNRWQAKIKKLTKRGR